MSHNKLSVNDASPDSSGLISLPLTGLSSLSGLAPSDGQIIKTDGNGDWTTGGLPAVSLDIPVATTASPSYAVSSYNYGAGDNLIFYRLILTTSGVTNIPASGSYVPVVNSSWYMGFRFSGTAWQDKTVILRATPAPYCQASFVAQWGFGTGSLASFTQIGPRANSDATWADAAWGRFVGDGTTKDVALKIISRTGSGSLIRLANGNRAAHYSIVIKAF